MGHVTKTLTILLVLLALAACGIPSASAGPDMPGPIETPTTEPPFNPVTQEPTFPPVTPEPTFNPVTPPTTQVTITIEPTPVGGGKGWIDTYCNVDGASVYFDGGYQGMIAGGILSVPVSPSGTPVSTVTVSKAGYNSWSGSLSHMPEDKEHVAVYATINPVPTPPTTPIPPQNGAIYAQSSPGGAMIYMNGNFVGYSPITIPNLPPGAYSMKAALSGYTPDTRTVYVNPGQTIGYYPTLQPSPPPPRDTGTVTIRSTPSGAQAYVDSGYRGVTPVTVSLYTGNHNVQVRLAGYNDYTTTVYVTGGSSQTVNPALTSATAGMLTISGTPAGAQVFVDSNPAGITDGKGTLTLNNIASGNHIVKVTAKGYNDWIETVYIRPNTNNYVPVTMTPSGPSPAPVPADGSLSIASTPAGADVYVDNIYRGFTPVTLPQIDPGQHTVKLQMSGYLDYVITAAVASGQTTPVTVTLVSAPAPTPTPASGLYAAVPVAGILALIAISSHLRRRT